MEQRGITDSPPVPSEKDPVSYSKMFEEIFPYYISIGMDYHLFYESDVHLVEAYRKADKLRRDRTNFEAWLNGRYIYDALLCASPMFHDFVKSPKPQPYSSETYCLSEEEQEERQKKKQLEMRERFKQQALLKNEELRKRRASQNTTIDINN